MTALFDWTQGRSRFPSVMFKRAFALIQRPVPPGAGIVTAYTDGQVTLRSNRTKVGYHEAADTTSYKGVEPGDFVVHGLDILRGSVGVSDSRGAISPVCTVCRALPGVDARFVAFAMRAQAAAGVPRAYARGVREGGADFRRWDTLGELPIPQPALRDQRRIADFLDDQVALLDRAIELRQRQLTLIDALEASVLGELLERSGDRRVAIKYLVSLITSGPRGWGDFVAEAGSPFLRIANVAPRGVDLRLDNLLLVQAPPGRERERSRTRSGDVLVSITAELGSVAVVPSNVADGNVSQHIALLRPRLDRCVPEYLAWAIKGPAAHSALTSSGYGGTKVGLGLDDVGNLRLHVPNLHEQQVIVAQIRQRVDGVTRLKQPVHRHLSLLAERKQALITAAVTGRFDITTGRSVA